MKTKVTWKESGANAKILKIDDTSYSYFPKDGEMVEVGDRQYRVAGLESATVLLEAVPEPRPLREPVADESVVVRQVPRSKALSKTSRGNKVVSHKKK